jgi:hypothetical protein
LLEFERVSRSCRLRHFRSPCVNLNTQQGIRFSGARSPKLHLSNQSKVQGIFVLACTNLDR